MTAKFIGDGIEGMRVLSPAVADALALNVVTAALLVIAVAWALYEWRATKGDRRC
jgi:hypothetical protein